MRYGLALTAAGWFVSARTRAGGFRTAHCGCLQDAYAWLFRLGAFDSNHFDNHAISGAKEEA